MRWFGWFCFILLGLVLVCLFVLKHIGFFLVLVFVVAAIVAALIASG